MEKKWALYIDIEGFSAMFRAGGNDMANALSILSDLAHDIFIIGRDIYPNDSNRLFVFSFGDAFIICPDGDETNVERPIAIAIALMRRTLLRGGTTRVSISQGDMADINGCYSNDMRQLMSNHTVRLGSGTMILAPVMGDAIVNCYELSKKNPRGPMLLIDSHLDLPDDIGNISIFEQNKFCIAIDWLRSQLPIADEIFKHIDARHHSNGIFVDMLKQYLMNNDSPSKEWKESTQKLIDR